VKIKFARGSHLIPGVRGEVQYGKMNGISQRARRKKRRDTIKVKIIPPKETTEIKALMGAGEPMTVIEGPGNGEPAGDKKRTLEQPLGRKAESGRGRGEPTLGAGGKRGGKGEYWGPKRKKTSLDRKNGVLH